jgi:cytochrome c5
MKHATKTILVIALVTLMASMALAAEGGNPKKGKYLFKKNCKTCHGAAAAGGELTPLSKIQRQWDRFFEKNNSDCLKHLKGQINETDLRHTWQFLYDHASDSDQPETCG